MTRHSDARTVAPRFRVNARVVAALGIVLAAGQAAAACVADSPLETARWIRANQSGFAIYRSPQDTATMARFLSPRLLGLLKVEWQCQVIEEGLCAVESDPWTNALEGDVLGPLAFEPVARAAASATIDMRFRFGWSSAAARKPVPAQARLTLVKDTGSGCWLLDDLVGGKGQSLVGQLRSYRFYP